MPVTKTHRIRRLISGLFSISLLSSIITSHAEEKEAPIYLAESIGIRAANGQFARIVYRGDKLPISAERMFTAPTDGAVSIDVFAGESASLQKNRALGTYTLGVGELGNAGDIQLQFKVSDEGTLTITIAGKDRNRSFEIKGIKVAHKDPAPEATISGVSRNGNDVVAVLNVRKEWLETHTCISAKMPDGRVDRIRLLPEMQEGVRLRVRGRGSDSKSDLYLKIRYLP